MKLYQLLVLFFLYHCSCDATIYFPKQVSKTDKQPILIFDADQVLLDRTWNIPLIFFFYMLDATDQNGLFIELPKMLNLDCDKITAPIESQNAFNSFIKAFNKDVCNFDLDPAVDKLVEKYPILQQRTKSNTSFAEHLKRGCSCGIARQDSVNLLLRAHGNGYPIAIGTNQGYNTYKRLMDAKTVPGQDYYVVIYTCDHPNNKRPNPKPDQFPYAKKPSGKYFKGLRKTLIEKNLSNRLYIFIDDNLENVKKATRKGFIGIHFETAAQTERDLIHLGINL
jgi:FMN phosphatase YigB (HAD superfamily)